MQYKNCLKKEPWKFNIAAMISIREDYFPKKFQQKDL